MGIKRKFYLSFSLILIALLYVGCGGSNEIQQLNIPDFDFTPPNPVEPGSSGINIVLINPGYQDDFLYSNNSPFKQFKQSMGKDFEEILTARGFIIKGPYEEYDLMTYSDKMECNLGLEINIGLNIVNTTGGWENHESSLFGVLGSKYSTYEGTLNLRGKITISVIETFTRQKLLVKSFTLTQENILVATIETQKYGSMGIPLNDPGVHNPIANTLSVFYKTTMQRGWDMLTKEGLKHVDKQAPEIREKAGFIKN